MCWTFAIPGPRVIAIKRCITELVRNDWVDVDSSRQKFAKSNAISPAMLLVNSESREVTLKYYKLSFGDLILEPAYFDFDRDSLYFPSSSTDLGSFLIPD
ncbi:hypothetical protein DL95DRAFT_452892 [Leptodontidium sp. 2 PMI_412]|nr:hypothetical protein DL95DRAFT_452892 [Leptodontidium sp. 2 PMI_412]